MFARRRRGSKLAGGARFFAHHRFAPLPQPHAESVQGLSSMPSTHLSLHYHIVFSTQERRRIIADPWRNQLHAYIGGIIKDMNAIPEAVGGPGDHAHVVVGLRATHMLA